MYVEEYETVKSVKKIPVLVLRLFTLALVTPVCIFILLITFKILDGLTPKYLSFTTHSLQFAV